jgi:hypothetical protein
MRRFGSTWRVASCAFTWWSLTVGALALAETDPLQEVRDALASGNAAAAAAAAEIFIAGSPGDARLADAQWLLALARERAGAWGAAWDQYSLFVLNFPGHPARDEAESRAEALVRHITERERPRPVQWRVTAFAEVSRATSDDEAAVVAVTGADLGGSVARTVTRAAVDGARVWVWRPLGTNAGAFDPFDDAQVARLEREFHLMAAWPIEGFVIDAALYVGDGVRSPAADRAYGDLAAAIPDTAVGRERLAWTWAGMRGRASARALHRWVEAVASVNPSAGWLVRVSTSAVAHPEGALRAFGEDLAELRAAAPAAIWAIDAPIEFGARVAAQLTEWGSRPSVAVWSAAGHIVAVP